jgi:hypothetical protein
MEYQHLTANWFQSHPITFTLIISILFFVLNLFTTEIKSFISHWPKEQFQNIRYNTAVIERQWLQDVFNNSYRLTLYYGYNVVYVLMWYLVTFVVYCIAHQKLPTLSILFLPYFAIGAGNLIDVYRKTRQLMKYYKTIEKLDAIIAKYSPETKSSSSVAQ